jgi:hypothetical protein
LKSELFIIAEERDMPIEVEEPHIAMVDLGWCGRLKGLKQVLLERSLAGSTSHCEGRQEDLDEHGKLNEEGKKCCLPCLLNQCKDFIEEKTDLKHILEELSVELDTECTFCVLFAPKCHCEMAGEGSEFSWGAAKRVCQKLPVQNASFQQRSIKRLLACANVDVCRNFSRRARRHMLTCHHHALEGDGSAMGFENNERLLKAQKAPRDANIFDGKHIMQMLRESCGLADVSNQRLVDCCDRHKQLCQLEQTTLGPRFGDSAVRSETNCIPF